MKLIFHLFIFPSRKFHRMPDSRCFILAFPQQYSQHQRAFQTLFSQFQQDWLFECILIYQLLRLKQCKHQLRIGLNVTILALFQSFPRIILFFLFFQGSSSIDNDVNVQNPDLFHKNILIYLIFLFLTYLKTNTYNIIFCTFENIDHVIKAYSSSSLLSSLEQVLEVVMFTFVENSPLFIQDFLEILTTSSSHKGYKFYFYQMPDVLKIEIIFNTLLFLYKQMKGKLKQKHLQNFLQDIDDFQFGEKQKINLQQHMTPPDIAAKLLFYIYQNQPIEEYFVMDIGVGTGMLTCGLIYLQPDFVLGIQIDEQYIELTRQILEEKVEGANYELINADARSFKFKGNRPADLVVMNPPFGTKEAGIDMIFLELAMKSCRGNIYSMHKTSTRDFIVKFCQERGYCLEVIFSVKFPLKKRFKKYHKKEVAFTEVDIIKVFPKKQ